MKKFWIAGMFSVLLLYSSAGAQETLNFMQRDSNGNGRLTPSEAKLPAATFAQLDRSKNGEVSLGEFASYWRAHSAAPNFAEQHYGKHPRQSLDLYLPDSPEREVPLVLWIHGGSWQEGSKDTCPIKNLTNAGFAVAALNYRYAHQAYFPAQLKDCSQALTWLREHQEKFGVQFGPASAVGYSAGGQLALLLGSRGKVDKVVAFGAPVDFTQALAKSVYRETLESLVGSPLEQKEHLLQLASPLLAWNQKSAKLLLFHGLGDRRVPASEAEKMAKKARTYQPKAKATLVPDGSHSLVGGPKAWDTLVEFLGN